MLIRKFDFSDEIEGFTGLSDRIHDLWFSVDSLKVDVEAAQVTVGLFEDQFETAKYVLICAGVDFLNIIDPENVGWYDINYLSLSRNRRELRLICNIPIDVILNLRPRWSLSLFAQNSEMYDSEG